MADEDIFSFILYLIHEIVINMSDSKNEAVARKYGMPEINEVQRIREIKMMDNFESGTNMETLYTENNIDPNIVDKSTSNYRKMNEKQMASCDDALEIML